MHAVSIEGLSKSYDNVTNALNNINFDIPKGEVFGFLGPNGSGKTTTVRILNGILGASSGKAQILGKDIKNNTLEIHNLCGVMTESASCYENLTGEQNLLFFGRMFGLEEKELKKRTEAILRKLALYEAKDKKVKQYSTGMRKRISLGIALINNPKVLFLDEPTSGLDPETALNVTKLIKELAVENEVTIFLCTHQLKYAEDICTLYGFINKGEILGFGTFEELAKKKNAKTMLKVRGEAISENFGFKYEGDKLYRKPVGSDEEVSELLYNILKVGGKVYEASHEKWNLEQLYFSYFRRGDSNE